MSLLWGKKMTDNSLALVILLIAATPCAQPRGRNAPTSMREATKTALRDLQTMEQDASFKEMADALPAFPISSRMRLQADR